MPYRLEMTDTYGGESNYTWVRRAVLRAPSTLTRRQLARAAKRWAGWSGHRCETTDYGDLLDMRPRGACMVLFAQYVDESEIHESETVLDISEL